MSTRFYANQTDYIFQLNLMDDQFTNSSQVVVNDTTTNATVFPLWNAGTTGQAALRASSTKLSFNPSTGLLTATGFAGALTGNVNGTATNATNGTVTNDVTTNASVFPLWVTANTGNLPAKVSSTKLSFNPSTGVLTSTGFSGPLTGNVTGNASGTALNVTGIVAAINGGTGQSSFAIGDLLYAATTTTLGKLAGVATGNVLLSGGVTTAPAWGKVGLTTHVSGSLPIANGGTAATDAATALSNLGGVNATFVGQAAGFRNRIVNGDMRIDQRQAGAAVTPGALTNVYAVDRWGFLSNQASKIQLGRNLDAVTPPDGFSNYLGAKTVSAFTPGASDFFILFHRIEGFNSQDFGYGTATAKTGVLSFLYRSSVTGTHSGSIQNGTSARSYPFTFTVSAANTWEYKTVVIPGDTTGTWDTTSSTGIAVNFSLGAGSTFRAAAGAWGAGNFIAATGSVDVSQVLNSTAYATGVQFELGSVATSFERYDYATGLTRCQRYFEPGSVQLIAYQAAGAALVYKRAFITSKRAVPTIVFSNTSVSNGGALSCNSVGVDSFNAFVTATATTTTSFAGDFTASCEL